MAQIGLTIGVAGEKQIYRRIGAHIQGYANLVPAWKDLEKTLNKFQKSVFLGKGKGSSDSWHGVSPGITKDAWKPLKPATIAAKRRDASAKKQYAAFPLIRTGKLMDGFTKNDAEGAVRVKLPKFFAWGIDESEIPYGKYHHKGGGRLPQRKILRIPKNLGKILEKIIQKHIVRNENFVRKKYF